MKALVKEKYSAIAQREGQQGGCCGSACGCATDEVEVSNVMADDYSQMAGYADEADLGLGCGLPTQFAQIHPGDTVIDLGSGAGNDCFIARHETSPSGRVIGIDFSGAMIEKARTNTRKLGYDNVEFILGDIEDIPLPDDTADVAVSNCVLNLLLDKSAIFGEVYRVLKPGGHFSISDVVLKGELPEAIRKSAELYVGCVSGAIQKEDYLAFIQQGGFTDIALQKEREITLPDDMLENLLSPEDVNDYKKNSGAGVYSITVFGKKPI